MIPGGRNFKGIEKKKIGRNWSRNRAKTGEKQSSAKFRRVKETSAKWHFAAKPFRSTVEASASVFRNCESGFGTRVPLRRTVASICSCETIAKWKSMISHQKSHSAGHFAIAKVVWHTSATSQHSDINFAAAKLTAKLLRKWQRRPKIDSQNGTNARGKVFIPFEPQKESAKGAKSRLCSRTCSKAFAVETTTFSSEAGATKAAGKAIFNKVRRSAIEEETRVESSEPIDLTEQSPEKSPNPSPVQIPVPSPVPSPIPSPEATPIPSPVPSPAPQEKAQEPQAPIPEPQIAAEAPLEEVIRRPMLPQPPIEGNLDCELGHSILNWIFSIPGSHGLLPDHDNQRSKKSNSDHFIIDGRHGILGARHIAEALQIPFEPTQFDNFKAWTNPTELEMVSTLSRGAANRSHLLRGELPPVMFLIDAFLRHNIYPLQHWTQRRGVLLEALYKMSEGFFFGPHHLIMAALLYFEEKVHKKSFKEQIAFHSSSQGCYAKFWSISDTPLSLSRKEREYAPGQPQPAARRASPRHPPEGITLATPAIPRAPPAAPAPSQPSTSAEPRMAIPISEYRELCRALETLTASQSNLAQELAAIKACQEQMLASQAQQAAILRQLQVHFDLPQAVEPSTETPPEPHSQPSESQAPEPEAPADPPTEEADPSA
ncbi:hypothetical protein CK203_065716 [Vitis vinifera]|uniref:Uncharacterized protein n=1 Tax=Vitis vinifera TaxID=29760 RepID=A0A438FPE5_VITVI|nr:hypothetical protein CK203_065716 [Vitis vinifera]